MHMFQGWWLMRLLERDKKPFWYANYIGREMLTEGQNYTGERSTEYDTPAQAFGTFSDSTGAMDQGACPFDENAAIWLKHSTDEDPDFRVLRIAELQTYTAVAIRQLR